MQIYRDLYIAVSTNMGAHTVVNGMGARVL